MSSIRRDSTRLSPTVSENFLYVFSRAARFAHRRGVGPITPGVRPLRADPARGPRRARASSSRVSRRRSPCSGRRSPLRGHSAGSVARFKAKPLRGRLRRTLTRAAPPYDGQLRAGTAGSDAIARNLAPSKSRHCPHVADLDVCNQRRVSLDDLLSAISRRRGIFTAHKRALSWPGRDRPSPPGLA